MAQLLAVFPPVRGWSPPPSIQPVSPETGGLVQKKPGRYMERTVNEYDAKVTSHLPYPRLVFFPIFLSPVTRK